MTPAEALGGGGRWTRARVDLGAFAYTVRLAVRLAGPERRVMAVDKADAYGHGAAPLAATAVAAGATQLGVAV